MTAKRKSKFPSPVRSGAKYLFAAEEKPLEKEALPAVHPLAHIAGAFNDEPLWDEFWQAVLEYRKEQNEREDSELFM